MTKRKAAPPAKTPGDAVVPTNDQREKERDALAKDMLEPNMRHALLATKFTDAVLNGTPDERNPDLTNFYVEMLRATRKAESGDLAIASRLLVAQAISLDGIFTEMARRGAANMREYPQAMEIFMRVALKAQANSRATLEALAKLHQPREQTVRHVHVNEGGQAVIADQFHHHAGGAENGHSIEQPHAQGARSPALPSPDPIGNGVQIASGAGRAAVPDARRQG